jgi:transcriptional regulator with GAF, ATPase, and Fis domain
MANFTIPCDQLEDRLAALHQVSLELVQNFSLDSLLQRIIVIAREQTGARYAALGSLDEEGKLERFIPLGMPVLDNEKLKPPVGLGLLGALMNTKETILLEDISSDPRVSGFPAGHLEMKTFLGVPIWQGDRQFGQIYLTDKLDGTLFTYEDQQVIETLAAYAGVAIANARLYNQLTLRDRTLTRRNQNLALLNELASTLASSTIRPSPVSWITCTGRSVRYTCRRRMAKPCSSSSTAGLPSRPSGSGRSIHLVKAWSAVRPKPGSRSLPNCRDRLNASWIPAPSRPI